VAKDKSVRRQTRQYDKIIRENLEMTLPFLMEKLLHVRVAEAEELPDDIQHTKERQPDVLKKITDLEGENFVLHIEFQVKNEPEMVYRMAEYYIMLSRKYKMPVRQYVIYLGNAEPVMPVELNLEQMNFVYHLVNISQIDYRQLLAASDPQTKMLAVLADFKGISTQEAVDEIAKQVFSSSEGDFAEQRHLKQLRILMKLRNLDVINLDRMDSLAPFLTAERDFLYKIGERKGLERGETRKALRLVKNLLRKTDFTIAQIADLAEVSQYFVRKVKRSVKAR
jgi:predicted transposase/invertase (TIGR01784 family)